MQMICRNQMLGTSNPTDFVLKPKLSSLNLQSSSTTCFSGLCTKMISLSQLSHLLLLQVLLPVQHHSLVSLDCFPQSSPYTGFNNQLAKKVLNPSQLADPSTTTANYGFTCQMFSHSTIPTREGKQSLSLS